MKHEICVPVSQSSNASRFEKQSYVTAQNYYDLPRSPAKESHLAEYSEINDRDLEMDNLKTIIIALNQKVKTRDDIEANLKSIMKTEAINALAREDLRN